MFKIGRQLRLHRILVLVQQREWFTPDVFGIFPNLIHYYYLHKKNSKLVLADSDWCSRFEKKNCLLKFIIVLFIYIPHSCSPQRCQIFTLSTQMNPNWYSVGLYKSNVFFRYFLFVKFSSFNLLNFMTYQQWNLIIILCLWVEYIIKAVYCEDLFSMV